MQPFSDDAKLAEPSLSGREGGLFSGEGDGGAKPCFPCLKTGGEGGGRGAGRNPSLPVSGLLSPFSVAIVP